MRLLKKLLSSFGIFQYFVLIICYLFLVIYKNDTLLILAFFYSLFLGFFVIKNRVNYLLANGNALIFLIFLFLYGIFQAMIEKVLNGEISDNVYISSIIYASAIPAYIIGWSFNKKEQYDKLYESNIKEYKNNNGYNLFLIIILLILIGYVTYFFYSIGALFNPSVLEKDRSTLFEERGMGSIVIGLLISGIFLHFIYYFKKIPKKILYFVIAILIYYILLQLSAGNRRDFMPMILGIFWVVVNIRKIKFTFSLLVGLLIAISVFQYLGTIRSNLSSGLTNVSNEQNIINTLQSNEFVYPFYTLSFDVENYQNNQLDLKYGESYLYPIIFFIPRNIYPEKPYSLADQFIKRNFGNRYTMGFAYTPVTEAFVNFGYVGPFFFYLFLGFLINKVANKKNQVLNFIFFTMILDLSRGESGTFFYQFFFVSLFLLIIPGIIKLIQMK
ncbi:hypothetical protein ACM40_08420 [Chryseobacterium sp. BLS98]|uniref:O-antigen polymerase n=1 Tax=Chryseobacterium sp. BLS98 TaxID=885586 RepID=UPI00065ACA1E|nr:O-antigen polymerase [Chryseobacterium sp. BLS98]KMQ62315.1 hypothetical protein ACM40_08420 [Chryseobacterium sp. BLS98]